MSDGSGVAGLTFIGHHYSSCICLEPTAPAYRFAGGESGRSWPSEMENKLASQRCAGLFFGFVCLIECF